MTNYVHKTLHRFQHIVMGGKEYSPIYVTQSNMDRKSNMRTLWIKQNISDTETNLIQQVRGTFLYYAIITDNNILPTLSDIYLGPSKAMKNKAKQVKNS